MLYSLTDRNSVPEYAASHTKGPQSEKLFIFLYAQYFDLFSDVAYWELNKQICMILVSRTRFDLTGVDPLVSVRNNRQRWAKSAKLHTLYNLVHVSLASPSTSSSLFTLDTEVDTHLTNECEQTNICSYAARTALPVSISLVFRSLRYVRCRISYYWKTANVVYRPQHLNTNSLWCTALPLNPE
jgi:hypothetical protein